METAVVCSLGVGTVFDVCKKGRLCIEDNAFSLLQERLISATLHELGVLPNLRGYIFLRDAILVCLTDIPLAQLLLYQILAKKHDTSAKTIESNIRTAIRVAGNSGKLAKLNELLGMRVVEHKAHITNMQLVALLTEYFRYTEL